jgi:integrase
MSWDDAITLMLEHQRAEKLRSGTIQQYELALGALRKTFPKTFGPADITPAMAERFKVKRSDLAPKTVEGNIKNCLIAYNWFVKRCKILRENPFVDVTPPKYDKTPPRIVKEEEIKKLKDWLSKKWGRLPVLLIEVLTSIGCRIGELCQATTDSLHDGRLYFMSETTKGRRQRVCKLPETLYKELRGIAGPVYIFNPNPRRFKKWLQDQAKEYFRSTKAKRFKLHSLRATAMTGAREVGIPVDDAAVFFGCNPETMKQYYLAPDEVAISDSVFDKLRTV